MKDRFVFWGKGDAAILFLYLFLLIVGGAIIAWQIIAIARKSRKLDERIEEYHQEGPPRDPYAELARIMMEDQKTKRFPKSRRQSKPVEGDEP